MRLEFGLWWREDFVRGNKRVTDRRSKNFDRNSRLLPHLRKRKQLVLDHTLLLEPRDRKSMKLYEFIRGRRRKASSKSGLIKVVTEYGH